jgi:hypothetical protein
MYLYRTLILYVIAASVGGVITFVALILIYAPQEGLLFLAGVFFGALSSYAFKSGLVSAFWARSIDAIQHRRVLFPY